MYGALLHTASSPEQKSVHQRGDGGPCDDWVLIPRRYEKQQREAWRTGSGFHGQRTASWSTLPPVCGLVPSLGPKSMRSAPLSVPSETTACSTSPSMAASRLGLPSSWGLHWRASHGRADRSGSHRQRCAPRTGLPSRATSAATSTVIKDKPCRQVCLLALRQQQTLRAVLPAHQE